MFLQLQLHLGRANDWKTTAISLSRLFVSDKEICGVDHIVSGLSVWRILPNWHSTSGSLCWFLFSPCELGADRFPIQHSNARAFRGAWCRYHGNEHIGIVRRHTETIVMFHLCTGYALWDTLVLSIVWRTGVTYSVTHWYYAFRDALVKSYRLAHWCYAFHDALTLCVTALVSSFVWHTGVTHSLTHSWCALCDVDWIVARHDFLIPLQVTRLS